MAGMVGASDFLKGKAMPVTRKPTINLAVDPGVLSAFERVAGTYGHGKQKGLVLTAAMLHFLEADPGEQARCVEAVMRAELAHGSAKLVAEAKRRQAYAVGLRDGRSGLADAGLAQAGGVGLKLTDAATKPEPGDRSRSESVGGVKPKRAAKKRGASKKAIKRLPRLEDLA